jgi:hypothetical protein
MPPTSQYLPQSLLRRVETHVRVMSYPQQFAVSRQHNNNNKDGIAGASAAENVLTIIPATVASSSPTSAASPGHFNDDSSVSRRQFSGFSKIHMNSDTSSDNKAFFDDVLKKIVPSALGGQSFTVLFCGAPSSGRSQTMYTIDARRHGGTQTTGMLHHLAEDLLNAGPNVKVMVSGYHVRGNKIFDSRNDRAVNIRQLPSPLGPTPETTSILLEKPEDACIIPNDKRPNGTCFVTVEIYNQQQTAGPTESPSNINGNSIASATGEDAAAGVSSSVSPAPQTNGNTVTKGAFSIITFVDVASFDEPMPSDVVSLRNAISRHVAGNDPGFGDCRLTQLLEASICRGRTMIGIATVVGQPAALFDRTCTVLDFVSLLSTIEQIASVAQFQHPKWFNDLTFRIRELDRIHQDRMERMYQKGVSEVYLKMKLALTTKLAEVEKFMSENSEASERLAELRKSLRGRLEQALAQLQAAADDEVARIDRNLALAAQKKKELDKFAGETESGIDVLKVKKNDMYLKQSKIEQVQADYNDQLTNMQGEAYQDRRVIEGFERDYQTIATELRNEKKQCVRSQEKIHLHWSRMHFQSALAKLAALKELKNQQLQEATVRAVNVDNLQRQERQQRKTNFNGGAMTISSQQQQQQQKNSNVSTGRPGGSTLTSRNLQSQQQQQQQSQNNLGVRRDRSMDSIHSNNNNNQQNVVSNNSNSIIPHNSANRKQQQQQQNRNNNNHEAAVLLEEDDGFSPQMTTGGNGGAIVRTII